MQGMRVIRRRATVAQQATVKHETAISINDRRARPGLLEQVAHGQVAAIEHGRPDHLPLIRQDHQASTAVLQAHSQHAGRIGPGTDLERLRLQKDLFLLTKHRTIQRDACVHEATAAAALDGKGSDWRKHLIAYITITIKHSNGTLYASCMLPPLASDNRP